MKKGNYLLTMIIFCIALLSSQSVMAKKLVYLGHEYDGKVKNKVPEGEGKILVGNLKILGTFSANTVTNASVSWHDQTIPNAMYVGTVVFDESNNITLKAGGKYIIYYFPPARSYQTIKDRKSIDETLTEDRITTSSSVYYLFNPETLKIPYTHSVSFNAQYDDYEGFNLPKYLTVTGYTNVGLEDIECCMDQSGLYNIYRMVKTKAFVYSEPQWDEKKPVFINDFKDNRGRTWNINYDAYHHESNWTVSYPGGSWYTKNNRGLNDSFELHFPDGAVVKTTKKYWFYLIFDDGLWISTSSMKNTFIRNVDKDLFFIPKYDYMNRYIYSTAINFETFSEQDVKKFIEEKILPKFLSKEGKIEFCLVKNADDTENNIVARYNDGKVTFTKQQQAQANEDIRKKYYDLVNAAKKIYGAKHVDAALKGELVIGMPFDLFREYSFWDYPTYHWEKNRYMTDYKWQVEEYNSALGIYRILRLRRSMSGSKIDYFKVWIRNGKISQIFPE